MREEEDNRGIAVKLRARDKKLEAVAARLIISGMIIVIAATVLALSFHIYFAMKSAVYHGSGLSRLYLCLSICVFVATSVLVASAASYALRRRNVSQGDVHDLSMRKRENSISQQHSLDLGSSGEHDKDCFSCMPNSIGDCIPGRSSSVLERSWKRGYGVKEDGDAIRGQDRKAATPGFCSDGSVKLVFSELYDYAIFAANSADISNEQLQRIRSSGNKEIIPTSLRWGRVKAIKLTADSSCRVVTYSPASGYPNVAQDLHIVRRVKLPFGWRMNNSADVMVEVSRSKKGGEKPSDLAGANVFYNVDVPITYCNLLKLMFSYQSVKSGETERLFMKYLRFFYSELWDLAERIVDEDKGSAEGLARFKIRRSFYYNAMGARFASDIVQNYVNFRVFMREYEKTCETRELFGFLESVRESTPVSFAQPSDSRSGYLFEVMCAIYGLSCSEDNKVFREGGLTPSMSQVLHYMFFFSDSLRKAVIVNSIVEETFLRESKPSFLCGGISYLKNSIEVMLRVYDAEDNSDTFASSIEGLYNASEENKHILAAMSLSPSGGRHLICALEGISDYSSRLQEFRRLKQLAVNPSESFVLRPGSEWQQRGNRDVFYSVPYAVVSTIECLEKEERAEVLFSLANESGKTAGKTDVLRLYRDMLRVCDAYLLECMWNNGSSIIGHGFYHSIVGDKVKGAYVLPQREEFIAVRTVIRDTGWEEEKGPKGYSSGQSPSAIAASDSVGKRESDNKSESLPRRGAVLVDGSAVSFSSSQPVSEVSGVSVVTGFAEISRSESL